MRIFKYVLLSRFIVCYNYTVSRLILISIYIILSLADYVRMRQIKKKNNILYIKTSCGEFFYIKSRISVILNNSFSNHPQKVTWRWLPSVLNVNIYGTICIVYRYRARFTPRCYSDKTFTRPSSRTDRVHIITPPGKGEKKKQ